MNKLKQDEVTPDLIDRINALAIDQSLTLPDGRVITCRKVMPESCDEECALRDVDVINCYKIKCCIYERADLKSVYFELTDAPATTGEGRKS